MSTYFKALKNAEITELLDKCKLGYLGTIGISQPYITPIAFAYKNGTLYFNTLDGSKKVENIQRNPKVCFLVLESKPGLRGTKQVAIFGEAERLKTDEDIAEARKVQLEKYRLEREGKVPPFNIVHYRIETKKIAGKLIV